MLPIGVKGPQVGLIAEQVQQVDPRLVATDASGTPFTVKYENLTAILAAAIQRLFAQLSDLANTVASFADHYTTRELTFALATGDDLTLKHFRADNAATDHLCLTDAPDDPNPVCLTKPELAALLSQSAAAGFANPSPAPTQTSATSQFANPSPASPQTQFANPSPTTTTASTISSAAPSPAPTTNDATSSPASATSSPSAPTVQVSDPTPPVIIDAPPTQPTPSLAPTTAAQ